jgi:hypothetical protein
MANYKEFQVEYTVLLPVSRQGNFRHYGNPFDRENILRAIVAELANGQNEPVDWSQTLGIIYQISETTRFLDSAWDNQPVNHFTVTELQNLLAELGAVSKFEKMRQQHHNHEA